MVVKPQVTPKLPVKILLVEDNDISRQLMTDFLTNCNYNVLSLADAKTFQVAMEQFRPNVILLDLKLPQIDGYTVLQILQSRNDWRRIPVIVVSAFAFNTDKERAFSLGARQYLVKPVKLGELITAIATETLCPMN